jgi:acyl-coenzyme A thioesterase PaaI-like protein
VTLDGVAGWVGAIYQAQARPEQLEARRLGAALRTVIDAMVTTEAPAEELAAAADQVEALAGRLLAFPHGGLYRRLDQDRDGGGDPGRGLAAGYPSELFDYAPVLGRSNPVAPPLAVEVNGGQVVGRAVFGHAYEGPLGCVHGGFIAACFDDVLGLVQSATEQMAVTGTLSVRYLAPTPLHVEVRFVGTLGAIEGRKIRTRGQLLVGERCTAEAEGLFITVGPDHFRRLHRQT